MRSLLLAAAFVQPGPEVFPCASTTRMPAAPPPAAERRFGTINGTNFRRDPPSSEDRAPGPQVPGSTVIPRLSRQRISGQLSCRLKFQQSPAQERDERDCRPAGQALGQRWTSPPKNRSPRMNGVDAPFRRPIARLGWTFNKNSLNGPYAPQPTGRPSFGFKTVQA